MGRAFKGKIPRIEQSPSSNGGVQSALAVSSVNSEIIGLPGALGLSITLIVISVFYCFKTLGHSGHIEVTRGQANLNGR